jgi:hypothetical protein
VEGKQVSGKLFIFPALIKRVDRNFGCLYIYNRKLNVVEVH